MKRTSVSMAMVLVGCVWSVTSTRAGSAGGEAFSYQGQLKQDGIPYSGSADMRFSLFDVVNHALLETTESVTDVGVVNGLFTVTLDFGDGVSIFDGRDWELLVAVRVPHDPTNAAPFTNLAPGQLITTAPYATTARSALTVRGIDGHSLDAADGSPGDAVFVDNAGNVGIGTTVPTHPLHIVSPVAQTLVVENTGAATNAFAVHATAASPNAQTIRGEATSATGFVYGVTGFGMNSPNGTGVWGRGNEEGVYGDSLTANGVGVLGASTGASGTGVFGQATATTGSTRGVHGRVSSPDGFAGYFEGGGSFSDDVGIGTAAPARRLHVSNGSSGGASPSSTDLLVEDDATCYLNLMAPDASEHGIVFGSSADNNHGGVYYANANGLSLRTGGNATRMVIDAGGDTGIGTVGHSIDARLHVESDGARVAKFDRYTSDGELVVFARDDSLVGSITVAAGVVSYSPFTGSHYAWSPQDIPAGALVSMSGENRRLGGRPDAEVVYGVTETWRPNDPACLGVYLGSMESSREAGPENPLLVAAVGNGEMCVVDGGVGDVEPGDYLISSDVRGCAMRDHPARFRLGHVIAKAAARIRWNDVATDQHGVRRARISVLFGSFVRGEDTMELRERLARLEALLPKITVAQGEEGK